MGRMGISPQEEEIKTEERDMMEVNKIRGADVDAVANAVDAKIKGMGYAGWVNKKSGTSFDYRNIRKEKGIKNIMVSDAGYFGQPSKGYHRTKALSWNDWVKVNNAVNDVLDRLNVKANVHSLGGKFKIREGDLRYSESDWESLGEENVGSQMNPQTRKEHILTRAEAREYGLLASKKKKLEDVT